MKEKNNILIKLINKCIARFYLRKPELEPFINQKYFTLRAICNESINMLCMKLGLDIAYRVNSIVIEPTNRCNIACLQCPVNRGMKREKGFLDVELFKKVIDNNPGLQFVIPYFWGEPLLHPQFYDMVSYAVERNLRVYVSTNAVLLDTKARITQLLTSGISAIQFSLDGVGETFTRVRGVEYEKIKTNIDNVIRLRKELGKEKDVEINIHINIFEETEHAVEQVMQEWENRVDWIGCSPKIEYKPKKRSSPCFELWRGNITILWDGRCVPCCADAEGDLTFGNVKENTLAEIWNGEKIRQMRKAHLSGAFGGLCDYCCEYDSPVGTKKFD